MTLVVEKTFAVEGIRIPDTGLAREITQFVRDAESALFCFTIRAASITGVRSPENVVVSSSIASCSMRVRCFTTWA
jgi:hypothetical protein